MYVTEEVKTTDEKVHMHSSKKVSSLVSLYCFSPREIFKKTNKEALSKLRLSYTKRN